MKPATRLQLKQGAKPHILLLKPIQSGPIYAGRTCGLHIIARQNTKIAQSQTGVKGVSIYPETQTGNPSTSPIPNLANGSPIAIAAPLPTAGTTNPTSHELKETMTNPLTIGITKRLRSSPLSETPPNEADKTGAVPTQTIPPPSRPFFHQGTSRPNDINITSDPTATVESHNPTEPTANGSKAIFTTPAKANELSPSGSRRNKYAACQTINIVAARIIGAPNPAADA